jgi:hypothetical protein
VVTMHMMQALDGSHEHVGGLITLAAQTWSGWAHMVLTGPTGFKLVGSGDGYPVDSVVDINIIGW